MEMKKKLFTNKVFWFKIFKRKKKNIKNKDKDRKEKVLKYINSSEKSEDGISFI